MKKVVIYKTQKSPTQSGLKKSDLWIMESFDTSYHEIDPLTGWIGTENNDHTIRLKFSSKEEAMAYAKEKHLYTEIIDESISNSSTKTSGADAPEDIPIVVQFSILS